MRINKSELSKKIGQLKGIVPSRTTIEALKGVLCSDGYLIASDTNLTVKAKLEGMEEETEPFIIPAKAFDFISSLPDGELEVSVSKGNLVIKTGKIKNQFKTLGAELFAYTKSIDTDKEPAKIPALKLKKAIDHVIYAVAVNGSNQQMLGMYLECMDGKLNFVGLDGHRIAWETMSTQRILQVSMCMILKISCRPVAHAIVIRQPWIWKNSGNSSRRYRTGWQGMYAHIILQSDMAWYRRTENLSNSILRKWRKQ